MSATHLFLNPKARLVIERAAELATGNKNVSNGLLFHTIRLTEDNEEFSNILAEIQDKKSISPNLIDKAAKMIIA